MRSAWAYVRLCVALVFALAVIVGVWTGNTPLRLAVFVGWGLIAFDCVARLIELRWARRAHARRVAPHVIDLAHRRAAERSAREAN